LVFLPLPPGEGRGEGPQCLEKAPHLGALPGGEGTVRCSSYTIASGSGVGRPYQHRRLICRRWMRKSLATNTSSHSCGTRGQKWPGSLIQGRAGTDTKKRPSEVKSRRKCRKVCRGADGTCSRTSAARSTGNWRGTDHGHPVWSATSRAVPAP